MNKEGQTPEQPAAPTSAAPAATPAASAAPTTAPAAAPQSAPVDQPITSEAGSVIVDNAAPAASPRDDKKRLTIIAAIVVVALLLIGGTTAVVVNVINGSSSGSKSGNTVASDDASTEEIESEADQLKDNSDIDGMVSYINDVTKSYKDGKAYQNLTKENIGKLYDKYATVLMKYITEHPDQREIYGRTILEYAHSAEDILQSADTAVKLSTAEYYLGSKDEAKKYRDIAIERNPHSYENDQAGQG